MENISFDLFYMDILNKIIKKFRTLVKLMNTSTVALLASSPTSTSTRPATSTTSPSSASTRSSPSNQTSSPFVFRTPTRILSARKAGSPDGVANQSTVKFLRFYGKLICPSFPMQSVWPCTECPDRTNGFQGSSCVPELPTEARCQFHQHFTSSIVSYKSVLPTFSLITVWQKNMGTKAVRKILVKLTTGFLRRRLRRPSRHQGRQRKISISRNYQLGYRVRGSESARSLHPNFRVPNVDQEKYKLRG